MTCPRIGASLPLLLLASFSFAQTTGQKRLELPASAAVIAAGVSQEYWARAESAQWTGGVPVIAGGRAVTSSPILRTAANVPSEARVTPLGPANVLGAPDARLDLSALKDLHWRGMDGFDTPAGRVFVGISFGLQGDPYLAVRAPGWREPVFHRFEMGMKGDWNIGGSPYRMDFDVSIFRAKVNNIVRVFRSREEEPFFQRTVAELQRKSFAAGAAVSLGGRAYRFFHADDVDASANPTRPDTRRQGLVFIENAGRGTGGFTAYILDASLIGPQAQAFAFENGQTVALRLAPDRRTLEVFALSR